MFSIKFLTTVPEPDQFGNLSLRGQLEIGDFKEEFLSGTYYWNKDQYLQSWTMALKEILNGHKAALITEMLDPKSADHIVWWPMYLQDGRVIMQNQLLFFKDLKRPFLEKDPFKSMSDYTDKSEDGQPFSKWIINKDDIEKFLTS